MNIQGKKISVNPRWHLLQPAYRQRPALLPLPCPIRNWAPSCIVSVLVEVSTSKRFLVICMTSD